MDKTSRCNYEIPIVFATDDNYLPYCGIAISSLIKYSNKNKDYIVYVIYTSLSIINIKRLEGLSVKNVSIKCVNITGFIKGLHLEPIGHLSVETTYRLLIPKLFPKYEKVLYLDCDIAILDDVSELFKTDLSGFTIGAVRGRIYASFKKYIEEDLGFKIKSYFNAGILLINCIEFEKNEIGNKCFELLLSGTKYITLDQDVLNITCQDKVKFLDVIWNFEWGHLAKNEQPIIDEYRKDSLNLNPPPKIIHYTTEIKPWRHPNIPLAEYFWSNAKSSIFLKEIIRKNTEGRFIFPFDEIKQDSNVVLYGAGEVGKVFFEQIKLTKYCNVIAWLDKQYEKKIKEGLSVKAPEQLLELPYDYIIIAIENKDVANLIEDELIILGANKFKMVWSNPNRI